MQEFNIAWVYVRVSVQTEDDMIVTLNHILVHQEESERLNNRRWEAGSCLTSRSPPNRKFDVDRTVVYSLLRACDSA